MFGLSVYDGSLSVEELGIDVMKSDRMPEGMTSAKEAWTSVIEKLEVDSVFLSPSNR